MHPTEDVSQKARGMHTYLIVEWDMGTRVYNNEWSATIVKIPEGVSQGQ